MGKDLEESGFDLINVIAWHIPGGTEENHKNLSQNIWCPG
jgi:hypothetical protein